jgi:hypothetical protein
MCTDIHVEYLHYSALTFKQPTTLDVNLSPRRGCEMVKLMGQNHTRQKHINAHAGRCSITKQRRANQTEQNRKNRAE